MLYGVLVSNSFGDRRDSFCTHFQAETISPFQTEVVAEFVEVIDLPRRQTSDRLDLRTKDQSDV